MRLDPKLSNRVIELLNVVSKSDNLALFMLAKDGIKAESSTPQKVGFSRKKYYTRLKQLVDAGLVGKYGSKYSHTILGSILYHEYLLSLSERIKGEKYLEMVEVLRHANKFTDDDIERFVSKVGGVNHNPSARIETVWSYEAAVSKIIKCIEFAKNEIAFATRFYNEALINNILLKAKSGVDVQILADVSMVQHYVENEKKSLQVLDKNTAERMNVVENPWYPSSVKRRVTSVPFSLMLVDGKEVGIEIVNSGDSQKFCGALFISDKNTCKELMAGFYQKWWLASAKSEINNSVHKTYLGKV